MALFIIERNFAKQLQLGPFEAQRVSSINDQIGVRWLYSFLSADQTKTYCLYEATNSKMLKEQARKAGLPADNIVEVTRFDPASILAQT